MMVPSKTTDVIYLDQFSILISLCIYIERQRQRNRDRKTEIEIEICKIQSQCIDGHT